MEVKYFECRSIVIFLLTLFLLALTGNVSAQSLQPMAHLPLLGGVFGQTEDCSSRSPFGPLTFYAGWGTDLKDTKASFDLQNSILQEDKFNLQQRFPVKGLWLGLTAEASLSQRLGLFVDGWILFAANGGADEAGTGSVDPRHWDTNTDWWFTDGALTYEFNNLGKFIGGLRYDRFAVNFKNPSFGSGANLYTNADEADFTVNLYFPYIGLQLDRGTLAGNQYLFKVIGTCFVGSDVKYNETWGNVFQVPSRITGKKPTDDYFIEAFGEMNRSLFGSANIGLFGRWNLVHSTKSEFRLDETAVGDLTHLAANYRFSFHRESLTFGGNLIWNF